MNATLDGRIEAVLPLDQLILEFLPPEGSMFAGIYPIGESVKAMRGRIGKGQIGSGVFTARIRLLHAAGLIMHVRQPGSSHGSGDGKAWQITKAGEKKLAEWKEAPGEQ